MSTVNKANQTITAADFETIKNQKKLSFDPSPQEIIVGKNYYEMSQATCEVSASKDGQTAKTPYSPTGAYIDHETGDVYIPVADQVRVFHLETAPDLKGILGRKHSILDLGTAAWGGEWEEGDLEFVIDSSDAIDRPDALKLKTFAYATALEGEYSKDLKFEAANYFYGSGQGSLYYDQAKNTVSDKIAVMGVNELETLWHDSYNDNALRNLALAALVKIAESGTGIVNYDAARSLTRIGDASQRKLAYDVMLKIAQSGGGQINYDAAEMAYSYGAVAQQLLAIVAMLRIAGSGTKQINYDAATWVFRFGDKTQTQTAIAIILKIAESGNDHAADFLYSNGDETQKKAATKVMLKIAESGNYNAACFVYSQGDDIQKKAAMKAMLKMAESGDDHAAYFICSHGDEEQKKTAIKAMLKNAVSGAQVNYDAVNLVFSYGDEVQTQKMVELMLNHAEFWAGKTSDYLPIDSMYTHGSDSQKEAVVKMYYDFIMDDSHSISRDFVWCLVRTKDADQGFELLKRMKMKTNYKKLSTVELLGMIEDPDTAVAVAKKYLDSIWKWFTAEDTEIEDFIARKELDCQKGEFAFQ